MEYISIKSSNVKYFIPLLPRNIMERLCKNPYVYGLGISDNGKAIGILVYSIVPSDLLRHCELIYIAISLEYQRKKIATNALMELSRVCYENCYYLHCVFSYGKDDTAIYNLLSNTGVFSFESISGNIGYIKKEDITGHELIKKIEKKEIKSIYPYSKILTNNKKEIHKILFNAGFDNDFVMGEEYSEYSFCLLDNEKVKMCVIVSPYDNEGDFEVSYLYSVSNQDSVKLIKMLTLAFSYLEKKMNEESKIYITTTNNHIVNMVAKSFPNFHIEKEFFEAIYDGAP